MIKPKKLQQGDKIAVVSLSWGGPGAIPHRFEAGISQLKSTLNLQIVEMPNTRRDPAWLAANPKARAEDLILAFSNPEIKGVFTSIGGDDSIRTLPYIDLEVFRNNPKVFLGFSDTTVTHLAMLKAGVVSFYGPSIMTSFAENTGMHSYTVNALKRLLFRTEAPGKIMGNLEGWTSQRLEWLDPKNQLVQREMQPHLPWRWLQGSGVKSGVLIGGCLEVLDWLRGTSIWPDLTLWRDAILFIETSEDAPTPIQVKMFLRSLGALGILSVISGILFGRPGGEILSNKFAEYDRVLVDVIAGEMGLNHLPIISCMDFGHTDPVTILPYGINAKIDCNLKTIDLLEPAVVN